MDKINFRGKDRTTKNPKSNIRLLGQIGKFLAQQGRWSHRLAGGIRFICVGYESGRCIGWGIGWER